jgi:hypothetical protein
MPRPSSLLGSPASAPSRGWLRARLAPAAFAAAVLASPACIIPSISQNGSDAGATTSAEDAGSAATVKGASCTQITSSISLCQFISACPNLSLSAQVFPECGFRIHGSAIDPECLCQNQYLCPIGAPTTCAEAATAAGGDTTYDSVCAQALTGNCQDLTAATGSGGATAACKACIANCDNVPSCIDACGC